MIVGSYLSNAALKFKSWPIELEKCIMRGSCPILFKLGKEIIFINKLSIMMVCFGN